MATRRSSPRRSNFVIDAVEARLLLATTISVSDASILEDEWNFSVPITRTGPFVGSVILDPVPRDGTAVAWSDFAPSNAPVTIPHGAASGSFPVQVFIDPLHEGDETFSVELPENFTAVGPPPTFNAGFAYPFPNFVHPSAMDVADFNRDGRPDLVVAIATELSFSVMMNNT